jgi:hypothetical protein
MFYIERLFKMIIGKFIAAVSLLKTNGIDLRNNLWNVADILRY